MNQSPNFDKITKEAGQFTSNAIYDLWILVNDNVLQSKVRRATERVAPKVLTVSAAASVDNLDLEGSSIVSFTGGSAQNFTGMIAPETGASRVVFVQVNGAGTITLKHNVTSEATNQLVCSSGADTARATNTGAVFAYLEGKWRQVV